MIQPPNDLTTQPPVPAGGSVTVGNFDGVHLGHRALVAAAPAAARPCVVLTFDPPPIAVLAPAAMKPSLTTLADRIALLKDAGADHVAILRADAALLALSAEAFFEDELLRRFRPAAIVEGYDFRFGRNRGGNNAVLAELCRGHGIAFREVPPFAVDGETVSSSRVRSALGVGDAAAAAALLGRSHHIAGTVVAGAKRGRTIGFPTANLDGVETLVPAVGVYAVRAVVDGRSFSAAANVGPNPTFGEDARKIEVHLLDFAGDLYGVTMRVEFVGRLRDTRPFAGVAELVDQLKDDVSRARKILGTSPPVATGGLRERAETVLRTAASELGLDAASLEVLDVTDGIARVRLAAACASCPAGIPMILAGLEQALKEHLPAVEFVEPVG